MIVEYHRPNTIEEALQLLARSEPRTLPLGGGTVISRSGPEPIAVVDLQALGLNQITRRGNILVIGAMVTLQSLLASSHNPLWLHESIIHETTYNIRQVASVAGALVACDGRSPFATAMLALDAKVTVIGEQESVISLGDLLPLRAEALRGKLITQVAIPLNAKMACEYLARTPADKPIVCAALAQWPSGRTRLALGGWGSQPLLAMDGSEPLGLEPAARNAFGEASDEWASAEYRVEVAATLARRCLEAIQS